MITLSIQELKEMLMDAARLGAAEIIQEQRPAADLISQKEAYEQFKAARVRRWVDNGQIQSERVGTAKNSKRVYSRRELLALDAAERMRPALYMLRK